MRSELINIYCVLKKKIIEDKDKKAKVKISDEKLIVDGKVQRDLKRERSHCIDTKISSYEAGKKLSIERTGMMNTGTSQFMAHLVKLSDPALLKSALAQITSDEGVAKATHNAYAFRPTLKPADAKLSDDGEFGAAKAIMSVLEENNIVGYMVVVTRWYHGHIGTTRFDAFKAAARKALETII